ncbi:hypothetical protein [Amycolatopsis sp. Hca4]|uniref:hypothetical protein n=1 Tax=Amycolatopsis sp. Hca4 TaxID=2742131 RepID=UPI001590536D|nr:hypothetical protein [Amycolatopsis sp. Hca4]QKV76323.1 hypothetical protein HUT10_22955 [Amycolatopsis sp. Hca4]
MSDDFGLPLRRKLPDDVRARLRAELRRGMGKRRPSRVRYVAAAAAVVVLAAGAVVATQVLRQPADVAPAPTADGGLTLDTRVATAALDRCWAALQAAGKSADGGYVPPREEWVPLFTQTAGADSVVALTAASKPMFCETTETTVTLSDPSAAPATVPGVNFQLLFHSATGVVGGLLGPGAEGASLESRTEDGDAASQDIRFSPVSRQFVAMTLTDPARTKLTLSNPPEQKGVELPEAPASLISVVDRPVTADRTSPAGRALGECLAAAEEVVPDAAGYAPGPLLDADGYQVVPGRRGDRVVVCTTEPDHQRPGKSRFRLYPDLTPRPVAPVRALRVSTLGAVEAGGEPGKSRTPFVLALPLTAAKAAVDFGTGSSVEADVVDGMASTWIPKERYVPDATARVVARDAKGAVVYDGTLPLL